MSCTSIADSHRLCASRISSSTASCAPASPAAAAASASAATRSRSAARRLLALDERAHGRQLGGELPVRLEREVGGVVRRAEAASAAAARRSPPASTLPGADPSEMSSFAASSCTARRALAAATRALSTGSVDEDAPFEDLG